MIRRLRQQQQKLQEPKTKSIPSTSENTTSSSSVVSLDVSIRSTSYQSNYTTSSPLYSHALGNINEDGQAVSYSRPPPLIEIESPLKGLSKLTTSGVVAPPNAIAPSSEQSNRDINTQYNSAASLRLATSKPNTESRLESPTYSSSYQRSRGMK